jgi:hypothetical protein
MTKMFVLLQRGWEDRNVLGVFNTLSAASAVALEYTNAEYFEDGEGPFAKYVGEFVVVEMELNVASVPEEFCM